MEQEVLDNWLTDGRGSEPNRFRADMSRFSESRQRFIINFWIMMLVMFAMIIAITIIREGISLTYRSLIPLGVMTAVYAAASLFGLKRGIERHRRLYESYVLTVEDECIIREQLKTPTIKIGRDEIRSISKRSNGTIVIKGASLHDTIYISREVERPEELEQRLSQFAEVKKKQGLSLTSHSLLLNLIAIGLMLVVIYSNDKRIITAAGIPLVGWYIWGIVQRLKNKNIPYTNKFSIAFSILLLVGMIVFVTNRLIH